MRFREINKNGKNVWIGYEYGGLVVNDVIVSNKENETYIQRDPKQEIGLILKMDGVFHINNLIVIAVRFSLNSYLYF